MSQRLKILIIQTGKKQREVAKSLGWSDSKLSDIITMRRQPSDQDVLALAGVLGVKEDKLRKVCRW